ncbi:MAG: hypothetical protein HDT40_05020 [Lachnospiraceae bacterium]|nr:hypothetical protein [Lachnospiraceae bacterium]
MKENILKKIITFLMIFYLTIATVGVIPVCAAGDTNNVSDTIDDAVNDNSEETEEAIEDSQVPAGNGAGKWGPAIYTYHFAWNAFHNQVQKDIVDKNKEKYKDNVGRELKIEYDDQKQEELGKKSGKADLWLEDSEKGVTYLWEVKPRSYEQCEDKKNKAKKQLKNYVDSGETYVYGDDSLDFGDGTTKAVKTYTDRNGVYDIEYTIYYWYGGDGLIFYCFEFSNKRKLTEEEIIERAKERGDKILSEAREEAIEDSVNMAYVYGNDIFDYEIDWLELIKVYYLAGQIEAWYINGYESWFFDTVDQQIVIASEAFLYKVNSIIGKDPLNVDFDEIKAALDDYITVLGVCCEQEFLDKIIETIHMDDREKIDPLTKLIQLYFSKYNQATTTNPPSDPLIIDLGEPGIKLCTMENGVNFDLDNNGYAEKTAWTGTEDGFLALDRDGNGKIENGGELFGDRVTLKDGTTSASGFEALGELDTNKDGQVDASDADFGKLLVWTDVNHNGISEANELKSLSAHGIISISLSHRETSITDEETGTLNAETADVTIRINGTEKITEISEFWFPVDTSDTTHVGIVTVGNIPDIKSALANDTTGELAKWVYMFTESHDYAWKRYYLRQILYILADAQEIDPASRGGNIDARYLKVIEKFMGREFDGVGGKNPNANAASILNEIYCDIETNYYNILNLYGELGGYLTLAYEYEDENGNAETEFSFVYYVLDAKLSTGENIDCLVYDLGSYLKTYDEINGTEYFDEYAEYFEGKASQYEGIISRIQTETVYIVTDENDIYIATGANEIIFGGAGNDEIHGNDGNDTLYGEEGNDTLDGDEGDDILCGGIGDDYLRGGPGDDTYVFNLGDGNDMVYDGWYERECGEDKIIFGEEISPDMIEMWTEKNNLIITYGEGDRITVNDAYRYSDGRTMIENIAFSDGTVWMLEDIAARASVMYGSDGDDTISGYDGRKGYSDNETIYGRAGNDTISGRNGNDTLYGEEGNDTLDGDEGDDVLCGGTGDDYLRGGPGDDTYIFNLGDGNDMVYDGWYERECGEDKIIFGEGISPEMIEMWTEKNNLIITYGEGDRITVEKAYVRTDGKNKVEYIEFSDGLVYVIDYENLILQLLTGE